MNTFFCDCDDRCTAHKYICNHLVIGNLHQLVRCIFQLVSPFLNFIGLCWMIVATIGQSQSLNCKHDMDLTGHFTWQPCMSWDDGNSRSRRRTTTRRTRRTASLCFRECRWESARNCNFRDMFTFGFTFYGHVIEMHWPGTDRHSKWRPTSSWINDRPSKQWKELSRCLSMVAFEWEYRDSTWEYTVNLPAAEIAVMMCFLVMGRLIKWYRRDKRRW